MISMTVTCMCDNDLGMVIRSPNLAAQFLIEAAQIASKQKFFCTFVLRIQLQYTCTCTVVASMPAHYTFVV